MKWDVIKKTVVDVCDKHGSEILTGVGIAGVAITAFLTAKATLKCSEVLKEENLTPKEKVKEVWKDYIPPVISGVTSVACIVASKNIDLKRNAALAAAATLSETALREYKTKAIEVLGEKQERKIVEAVAEQRIKDNPVSTSEVVVTGKGKHRFYDDISGRYFESDIESVRKTINDLNDRLRNEMYITVNEMYYELGLPPIWTGEILGWNIENGSIEPVTPWPSTVCDDGTPAIILTFVNRPRTEYR